MDYSLLLVIETLKHNIPKSKLSRNTFISGNKLIHIGIIDYLQDFNVAK